MKHLLCIMSLFALLSACSKQIDYPLAYEGTKLVVNAGVSDRDSFSCRLSKTAPPLGTVHFDTLAVEQAQVLVYENDQVIDTLWAAGSGWFKGRRKPAEGQNYQLRVETPDAPPVVSEKVRFPGKLHAVLTGFSKNTVAPQNMGFPTLSATIQIEDAPNEADFYLLEADLLVNGTRTRDFNFWIPGSGSSVADPCLTDGFFFPDICFDGQTRSFDLAFETQTLSKEPGTQLFVRVKKISDSYYKYLKSNAFQPEGFEIPFSETTLNYSNMEGGYGVFIAYTTQEFSINL
jgi:hypothetical protein